MSAPPQPHRIVFLIRALNHGGAERQLLELVSGLDPARWHITVMTFYDHGTMRPLFAHYSHIHLISLQKHGRWDVIPFLWRMWRQLRAAAPAILHSYLDMANVLALLMGRMLGIRVVWGVRTTDRNLTHYDQAWQFVATVETLLAPYPDLIIVNSYTGFDHAVRRGFPKQRLLVIPNGIDTETFLPDPAARQRLRETWGILPEQQLVGLVARLDPMKDHVTFLTAAALLAREHPNIRFVCIGDGPPTYRHRLMALSQALGLAECLHWVAACDEMPAAYNAFDVACSSSAYGEGFSNAIAEAMACGIPCVVTDVGDSARIVRSYGIVVRPNDPRALADALWQTLSHPDPARTIAARHHIIQYFARQTMIQRTDACLQPLAASS